MKTSLYLYGQKKDWGYLTYNAAIKRKILLANRELTKEYDKPMMERNTAKINDHIEAVKFNEVLLNE